MSGEQSFAAGLVGIVLDDRYRLDALLGEGGMGAVFRAHHIAMDRKVAVKLLKPHLTTDEAALQRFAREARSTMKVDSEHAVKVLDFGVTPQRDYYMVLEYLDGRTVQRELDVDGRFTPARTLHIGKQALRALTAAHGRGLIHRDIKPDNILLMRQGDDPDFAKVLDFGVAKLMAGAASSARSALAITQSGMVFGTPEFMSPEQACGQPLDPRSDLYSLAATMFAMLTGCGLYEAKSAIEWLTSHARKPPPHLVDGAPDLAAYTALDDALQRCLAKRREDRPQGADEMIKLLESVERTLGAAAAEPAASSTARGKLAVGPSSYFAALELDSNATPSPSPETLAPTTTGVTPRSGRRGAWLALGALIVVAMIVASIVVASKQRGSGDQRSLRADPVAKAVGQGRVDGGITDAPVPVAAIVDASLAVATAVPADAAVAKPGSDEPRPVPRVNTEVARLLAEAEDAQRAGNHLRQIVKAAAALHADPRNTRAKLILADGLIADGDLDRGCKYLRELGRNPTARARATKAGCPTN